MNSDDLAKNLAKMYSKQLAKSPSLSESERNFKTADENFYIYPGMDAPEEEDELSQSFDINFAQEAPFFRFRTNTDAKLDKLSDIRKKQAQIKTVKCDDSSVRFNEEMQDNEELFVRKDLTKPSPQKGKSKFSEQLKSLPMMPVNRFRNYSCFDGTSHPLNEVRTIKVFVTPLKEHRNYPLVCCVLGNAKIEEFIGFILFKCTQDYPLLAQQELFEDIKDYGLFITEEGEPDLDFPALDLNEPVQRFHFTSLTLAKRAPNVQTRTLSVVSDTPAVLNPVNRQSSIDTNKSLPTSVRRTEDNAIMNVHERAVEAPIYRAYRVSLVTKKHFRTEVQLGVSGEKVEIDPLPQKNSNYFFKPVKAIHYSMDSVAWCEISSRKSSRFEFKIAHNPMFFDPLSFGPSTSFVEPATPSSYTLKLHTFETDPTTATEIVMKVNNILTLRTSSVRREYLVAVDKTKKSFIRKKKFPI